MKKKPMKRKFIHPILLVIVCVLGLWVAGCTPKVNDTSQQAVNKSPIIIGAKPFTEQKLLMSMTSILLRDHGFNVDGVTFKDSPSLRSASIGRKVDLYWEYTNTAWMYYDNQPPSYDSNQVWNAVAEADKSKGLIWLPRSQFNSSWVVIMKQSLAASLGIQSVSDLAKYMKEHPQDLRCATNDEFPTRPDGLSYIEKKYDFAIPKENLIVVDTSLVYEALAQNEVQVAVGLAADGRIPAYHLTIIRDDRHVFPPYDAAPVVSAELLNKYPEIKPMMEQLTSKITNNTMVQLNYEVDVLHHEVPQVARDFLIKNDLIQS